MKLEKITISRGLKMSKNYNSYDYHVGLEAEIHEDDNVTIAYEKLSGMLTIMEAKEAERILTSMGMKKGKKKIEDDDDDF